MSQKRTLKLSKRLKVLLNMPAVKYIFFYGISKLTNRFSRTWRNPVLDTSNGLYKDSIVACHSTKGLYRQPGCPAFRGQVTEQATVKCSKNFQRPVLLVRHGLIGKFRSILVGQMFPMICDRSVWRNADNGRRSLFHRKPRVCITSFLVTIDLPEYSRT